MILIIGPTGSGKTLLLKRFEEQRKASHSMKSKKQGKSHTSLNEDGKNIPNEDQKEKVPPTVPTIGINICPVTFGRHKEVTLKEVGGSMAPLWKSSYKDADKVVFVVDLSNPFQVSVASTLLNGVLLSSDLKQTPILLVLNKIDNFCTVTHIEMKYLLDLEGILANSMQKVSIIESSAKYRSGLDDIIKWICEGT